MHPLLRTVLPSLIATTCATLSFAQGVPSKPATPPAAEAPARAAPDVVVMKDGSLVRGTISELKKGELVAILMLTGELRTIPWQDVQYAGPESDRPLATPSSPPPNATGPTPASPPAASDADKKVRPFVTVRAGEAPFDFTATPTDEAVTLHVHSGSSSVVGYGFNSRGTISTYTGTAQAYTNICTAPCSGSLPAGTHRLALSQGKGSPVETDEPTKLDGPSQIEGEYISHQGTRISGWGIVLGSNAAAVWLVATAGSEKETCDPPLFEGDTGFCSTDYETNGTKLWGGLALSAVGTVVGLVLALTPDEAKITVSPANVHTHSDSGEDFGALPNGAQLTGRF